MSSLTTDPKYSYLEDKALKDLEQSTKQILLNKKIGFTSLLKLDEAKLEKLGVDYGDILLLLDFIECNKQQQNSPNNNNYTSTSSASAGVTASSSTITTEKYCYLNELEDVDDVSLTAVEDDDWKYTSSSSTAVKDTNIGGNLISSGVNAQNFDAHITNIIQQQTTPSCPKKLAVESLPRFNKNSFDLSEKKVIGIGATSNIYTHESKPGQIIALKIYHPLIVSNKTVQREIAALSFLRHQNILPVYGLIVDSDNNIVGYMMEKMSRSLQALLDDKEAISKISQQQKIAWLIQISSALVYSHDNKIFHNDINPGNILLTETEPRVCKISDFGSAHIIATSTAASASASSTSIRGTCGFTAPEWLLGDIEKPNSACDVFSFGMLIWCLFHPGVDKGLGKTEKQIDLAVMNEERPQISSSSSTDIPSEIQNLIVECWDQNPDLRPTMKSVLAKLERIIVVDTEKSSASSQQATQEGGESLSFYCDREITDEELIEKVRECKNLLGLNVHFTAKITDKSILWVAQHCKNLTSLNVCRTHGTITDASISAISAHCRNLTELNCGLTDGKITDASISAISASCRNLTHLNVYGTGGEITNTSISEVATHCKKLRVLNVINTNGNITNASLDKVREANPDCEIQINSFFLKPI